MEYTKNQQIIAFLAKNHGKASITALVKLAYIIDLFSIQTTGHQLSTFKYVRYYHGPYDRAINEDLQILVDNDILRPKSHYTVTGDEYVVYNFSENEDFEFSEITEQEVSMIGEVMENLNGYGAKMLTDIAYKTKPMIQLGATHGGDEHMNEELDLFIK